MHCLGNGIVWTKMVITEEVPFHMFNENLKTLRKAKGLSQEQLAIQLNVVRQTISK